MTYRVLIQELPAGTRPSPPTDRSWNTAPVIYQAESPSLADLAHRIRWFTDLPEHVRYALQEDENT